MSVTGSWIAGREAVLAVERFCLDQKWIYYEVPGHADFGKDGYVDIVTEQGTVTGTCFAVQIKGGRSFRRAGGYRIEASDSNRRQWARSTIPVIGVVWDPDSLGLFWVDLTDTLARGGDEADLLVPLSNRLNGSSEQLRRFRKYIGSVAHRHASILDLVSPHVDVQMAGVAAAYHIGRTDGLALVLLRRLFLGLHQRACCSAVWALASAVPHPDIFGSVDGSPDPAAQALLKAALDWTVEETIQLLEFIPDEGGISRGSFGQHIHQLIVADPDHRRKIRQAATAAARQDRLDAAAWALILAVGWAGGDGAEAFESLLSEESKLGGTWATEQIAIALDECGYLALY